MSKLTATDALREMLTVHYEGWKASLERLRETGSARWSDAVWRECDPESFKEYKRWIGALAAAEGRTISEARASIELDDVQNAVRVARKAVGDE